MLATTANQSKPFSETIREKINNIIAAIINNGDKNCFFIINTQLLF